MSLRLGERGVFLRLRRGEDARERDVPGPVGCRCGISSAPGGAKAGGARKLSARVVTDLGAATDKPEKPHVGVIKSLASRRLGRPEANSGMVSGGGGLRLVRRE